MTHTTVEPSLYREAMSRYAGHVQILTAEHSGVKRGVTVTAACSVSDNPGTVLACIAKANPLNEVFSAAGVFALNTLSAQHQELADIFSGLIRMEGNERFTHGQWDVIETGAPTLVGAAAVFDCRLIEIKDVATHMVLLGEVVHVRLGEDGPALIYKNRSYHQL